MIFRKSKLRNLKGDFPIFVSKAKRNADPEEILPGLSDEEIRTEEENLKVPLPDSYKKFLRSYRGFCLFGGAVQFRSQHPFFHRFPKLEELSEEQKRVVSIKGEGWPPPSDGMLCFAEYFRDADGDQVLFDVSDGLKEGEYTVYYYSHETRPPSVTKIADSFADWLNNSCIDEMV